MGKIFCKNNSIIIAAVLLFTYLGAGISCAAATEAELFEHAYEFYLSSDYEKAIEQFDLFLKLFPKSSARDSVMFWRAKSFVQMKQLDEAEITFKKLRDAFPDSSYSNFAAQEIEELRKTPHKMSNAPMSVKNINLSDPAVLILEDRINELEKEKAEITDRLNETEKARQLLEKGLARALKDKDAIESTLEAMKKDRDELIHRISEYDKSSKNIGSLTDENNQLKSKIAENESKITMLNAEKNKCQQQVSLITAELSTKVQESQKDWQKLDILIKELQSKIKEKDELIASEERRISETNTKSAMLEQKIGNIEESKKALEARLAESEVKIKALTEQIAKAKDIEKDKVESARKLQDVQIHLTKAESQQAKLMDERDKLKEQISGKDKKLSEISDVAKKLEAKLTEAERRLAVTEETLSAMKKAMSAKEQDTIKTASEYRDKLARLTAERDSLQQELKQEKAKTETAASKLDKNRMDMRVEVLQIKYTKDDEMEKGLIALEMRQEIIDGVSFEAVARKQRGITTVLDMSINRLPEWIRDRLSELKAGEVSQIFSADSAFLIVRFAGVIQMNKVNK